MGFWSALGKVAKVAAPIAATVMTGGAAAPLLAGGVMGALKKAAPAIAGAAGSAMSAASQASASNRGTQLDALMAQEALRQDASRDYNNASLRRSELIEGREGRMFDQMLAREKEGRESGKDALRSMQHASYIAGGGNEFKGQDGKTLGFGPKAASASEMQGAEGFKAEMMKRLEGGNQIAMPERGEDIAAVERMPDFALDPKLMQPGMMEKIGGIVGPGLSTWELMQRENGTGTMESRMTTPGGRMASAPKLTFLPQSPKLLA